MSQNDLIESGLEEIAKTIFKADYPHDNWERFGGKGDAYRRYMRLAACVQALIDAREAELRAEIERLRAALLLTYSIRSCDLPDDSEPWINCAQTIDAARAALEEK